jgi:hypothetical protein
MITGAVATHRPGLLPRGEVGSLTDYHDNVMEQSRTVWPG